MSACDPKANIAERRFDLFQPASVTCYRRRLALTRGPASRRVHNMQMLAGAPSQAIYSVSLGLSTGFHLAAAKNPCRGCRCDSIPSETLNVTHRITVL